MQQLHQIIVVGGGAGGLELVTQLGEQFGKTQKAAITLVDHSLTHVWKPLLHEIAVGTLDVHQEETNYFAHGAKHGYQFVLGSMLGVDREQKQLLIQPKKVSDSRSPQTAPPIKLSYDTLVIAIGSQSNDFNTKGVKEFCHFLDTAEQAQIFHRDLLNLYLDAQASPEARDLNIAIVGAGATGVELAAELMDARHRFALYGLNKIDPEQVSVSLIEASNRILPALSEKTAKHTHKQLEQLGVQVLTQHRVTAVDAEQLHFADGSQLPAQIKVWAAGIKAPALLKDLDGLETDHLNRLKVYATLQTTEDANIFAFGDCALCQPTADQPPLGPRAQVASQQASFLVRALRIRLNGGLLPMFRFSEKGSLVSLSQRTAIGEILGQVNVQGVLARAMYMSLHRLHQANIHGFTQAGLITAKDLVSKKMAPKIKLH